MARIRPGLGKYVVDTLKWTLNGITHQLDSAANYFYPAPPPADQSAGEDPLANDQAASYSRRSRLAASAFHFAASFPRAASRTVDAAEHFWDPAIRDDAFYTGLAAQTANLKKSIDDTLTKMMDPEEYATFEAYREKFFLQAAEDEKEYADFLQFRKEMHRQQSKNQKDYLRSDAYQQYRQYRAAMLERDRSYQPLFSEDPLYYYSQMSLLSEQLSEFLPYAGQLLFDLEIALNQRAPKMQRLSATSNLMTLVGPLNETFFEGVKPTYERLRVADNLPLRIPVGADFYNLADTFFPVTKALEKLDSKRLTAAREYLFSKKSTGSREAYLEGFLAELQLPSQRVPTIGVPAHLSTDKSPAGIRTAEEKIAEKADTIAKMAELLNTQLYEIDDDRITPSAKKDIQQAMRALIGIKDTYLHFGQTNRNLLNMLVFIYSSAWDAFKLLRHGSQALGSLGSTFHDDYLNILKEINLLFRETCLQLDAIELQCFMKEGCLTQLSVGEAANKTSLYTIMEGFASLTADVPGATYNYEYPEREKFPYLEAINEQRKNLLGKTVTEEASALDTLRAYNNTPTEQPRTNEHLRRAEYLAIKKRFLEKRQTHSQQMLDEFNGAHEELKKQKNLEYARMRSAKVQDLLAPHIQQLERSFLSWNTDDKNRRILLLRDLADLLTEPTPSGAPLTLDAALDTLKQHRESDFHLLWEGQTRDIMQQVENACLLPDACLIQVNLAIHQLNSKRFLPRQSSATLEKRIAALKYLHDLLETPGYRPSYALEKFSARNPKLYAILNKYDQATILKIEHIENTLVTQYTTQTTHPHTKTAHVDKTIANHLFGKILIGYSKPAMDHSHLSPRPDQFARLEKRISELQAEKNTFFGRFSRSTKDKKIFLLSLLQEKIKRSGDSLQAVLEDLAAHQQYQVRVKRPDTILEKGSLYFEYDVSTSTPALRYTLINPFGKTITGSIKKTDLPEMSRFLLRGPSLSDIEKLMPRILALTSTRGLPDPSGMHTYPPNLSQDLHLLRQGRTGALLKQLCIENLSPREVCHKIQREIERLRTKRTERVFLSFFRPRYKIDLEQDISLLVRLKEAMTHADNIDVALATLPWEDRRRLSDREGDLLKNLGATLPLRPDGHPTPAPP